MLRKDQILNKKTLTSDPLMDDSVLSDYKSIYLISLTRQEDKVFQCVWVFLFKSLVGCIFSIFGRSALSLVWKVLLNSAQFRQSSGHDIHKHQSQDTSLHQSTVKQNWIESGRNKLSCLADFLVTQKFTGRILSGSWQSQAPALEAFI